MQSMKSIIGSEKKSALALSGGKDSHTILFAMLELGVTPVAYSLHVEGNISTDFKVARDTCNKLGVEFNEVIIPKKIDINILTRLIVEYDRVNKVDVEVYYPILYLLDAVKERMLLVGITAGVMVPLSKKACIHFKNNPTKLNEWREKDWKNVTRKDFLDLNSFSDIIVRDPFYNRTILDWFKLQPWDSLHKPNQKQVLIDMFPEMFAKIYTTKQMSMQVGDSGIREIYEPLLLDKELNYKNRTRMIDLYKDIHAKYKNGQLI